MKSFGAFVLAALLAGCGSALHDATHPIFLSGKNAQSWIDEEVGAMLAARHPGVRVGHARCPFLLNLIGSHTERCTVPVGTSELRIDVAYAGNFGLRDVDALVVKPDAERELKDDLTVEYGVPFTVRCDGPPVRVLPLGGTFGCAIDAPKISARRIDVEVVGRDESLFPHHIKGAESRDTRMLGRAVAERTQGSVDVAGPVMERYLHAIAGGAQHTELVRRGLLGAARCPARIRLSSGSKHAVCTVRAGDRAVRYELRFDQGRGLVMEAQQIAVMPALRELAQRYYEYRFSTDGKHVAVRVNCGSHPVVVVEPGATLPCHIWDRDDGTLPIAIQFRDRGGVVSFVDDD